LKRIVVIGGGIGGAEAAISLSREFRKKEGYQIDLISDKEDLFIYPLSIWIPVGKRTPMDISMPLGAIAKQRKFNFIHEKVARIVSKENKVITDKGEHSYDYLVIAIGADKLRPKGIEHTLSICGGPVEAVKIRERFFELVAKGSGTIACGFSGNPKDSTGVRGGPVFEVLFNIDTSLREKGIRQNFKLIFFSPSQEAGKRLGGPGLKALQTLFTERHVEPIFGKKISEFNADGILFEGDEQLQTDLTIFTPGMQGHPVFKNSDLPLTEAGFIFINDFCQAKPADENCHLNHIDNCYVIGDSSSFDGPEWRAKQGHLAEAMARVVAKNIALKESGKPQTETFSQHLNILCVMDLGNEAAFIYRDDKRAISPIGTWAHWAKVAWEKYYKLNKKGKLPNAPL
jgi:sulfide:quinone oxidoreductase